MDLLFSRYASPLDLINTYIDSGRFGEFVTNTLELENERKAEKLEREENWRLWMMYTRLYPVFTEKTFPEWKAGLKTVPENQVSRKQDGGGDADLTEEGIKDIIDSLFSE